MENIGFQVLIFYLLLLNRPHEMVSEKLSCDIYTLFHQFSKAVHAVTAPFSFVETALAPLVNSQSFALVFAEISIVGITRGPFVIAVTVFLPIQKLALVNLSNLQDQFAATVLHILSPFTVVNIAIFILVSPLETHVVSKSTHKDIPIEQHQLAFKLLVVAPNTTENSAFTEIINSSPLLLPFLETALVLVFVHKLKRAFAVRHVISEIPRIGAAVSIDHSPLAVLAIIDECANIVIFCHFVEVIPVALSHSVHPLSLVELFFAVVDAVAVFEVIFPSAVVVGDAVVVKIDALTFHDAVVDEPVIDLPIGEDIYSLAVKNIPFP